MNKNIKFPFKLGLSGKIIFAIESFVILISLFVGISTHFALYDILVNGAFSSMKNTLSLKKEKINLFIIDVEKEIDEVVKNKENIKQIMQMLMEKKPDAIALFSHMRDNLFDEQNYFIDLILLDANGTVLSSSVTTEIGKSHAGEVYFTESRQNTYKESTYYDSVSSQHVMVHTTPIKDEKNTFLGIVVAKIARNEIKTLLTNPLSLGKTGEIFFVGKDYYPTTPLRKIKDAEFKKKIERDQIQRCLQGISVSGEQTDYNGDKVLGVWQWDPQTQSCLVVKFDISEILAPTEQVRTMAIISTVGIVMVMGILSTIIAQSITSPLKKLQSNIRMVMMGKIQELEKIESNDEVEDLSATFTELVQEIKSGREDLELKVKERTVAAEKALLQLEAQNISLNQGRMAVLNILEDEQDLEKELIKEKEGVEKKIEQRTQELGNEKARLMAAISSLPQAFLILNNKNEIVIYNNKLKEIIGNTDGLWTIQKINEAMGNSFNLEEYISKAVKERKAPKEKEVITGPKYLMVYTSPILPGRTSDSAEVIGSIVTITDVTEEKLLARSRDEFFSIASHALRTPLTAIRGNTSAILEYYLKDLPNEDMKTMITDIHSSSVHLISIVNDFLNMSRLEQNKVEYKQEQVFLSKIAKKIVLELGVNAAEKGVIIHSTIEENVCALADEGKVEQIFMNLVGNALKFTKSGLITITAHSEVGKVEIEFADTGSGIPIANQSLLFRKFQQAGTSTIARETAQGTGLGLYISRLMAEGMGGTLTLKKSTEGKGSVFALTLPIVITTSSPTNNASEELEKNNK